MFDENQLVEMKWSNGSKAWYESKGYSFTKINDIFYIKAKDLKPSSGKFVDVICDYCGEVIKKKYHVLYRSRLSLAKDCCSDCRAKKRNEISLKDRAKECFGRVEKICEEKDYELITTIDEYIDTYTKIAYRCPRHGIQETELRVLAMGCGCKECGNEKISNSMKLDAEYVNSIIESVDGNAWINRDEYKGYSVNNLKIMCKCGNIYTTSLSSYTSYNVTKCPECSRKESKAETRIKKFLNVRNIEFEQEKSFKDCRDTNALPFDFYLPQYNACIEYNGKQHYEPIDYFGGEDKLIRQQRHDKIKQEYCLQNNIKLICIPYWNENDIDKILTKQLNL